jgi:chromosome segregation ATPase
LIRAYNLIPFLDNVNLLDKVNISLGEPGKAAAASAADFRKFEEAQKKVSKTLKITAGDGATDKAKTALDKYTSALKLFASETKAFKDSVKGITTAQLGLANATDDVRVAQDKFNKISKGYGAGSKEAIQATRDLADARRDAARATISLRDATPSVADAQAVVDDLKTGKGLADANAELAAATADVANGETNILGQRGRARQAAQLKLEQALERQTAAQEKVNEESEKYTPKALADAEDDLTIAKLDLEEAQIAVADSTQSIIDKQNELHDVVSGAAADSQKYKDAQKELADAQKAERDAVDDLADAYDRQAEAARKLKKAKDDLTVASRSTTAKQEQSAQRSTGINLGSSGGQGFEFSGLPSIDFSNMDFSNIDLSGIDFSNFMPFMADGGIVNKPTVAMIGESGSEAVIPLSQLGNMGSSTNVTINVNGGDPNAVVDALRKYMRQNGSIPIRTSNIF